MQYAIHCTVFNIDHIYLTSTNDTNDLEDIFETLYQIDNNTFIDYIPTEETDNETN